MADEPARLFAPWSDEQVEQLNRYQRAGIMHEFTCGLQHREPRALVATREGWVCLHEGCTYIQTWAYAAMANKEWLDLMEKAMDEFGVPRGRR